MSNSNIGPQEVNKLITGWASQHENIRRPAEQAIEQFLLLSNGQIDQFVMTLCQLLSHPQQTSSEVRIRIAILLRTRIAKKVDTQHKKPIFCQLKPNTRQQTLRTLLKQLSVDPDQNTRNQIADCVIELSTRTLPLFTAEYTNVSFMKSIFELYNLSDTSDKSNDLHSNVLNRINALSIFGHLCQYCSDCALIRQSQASIAQIYKIAFKSDTNRKVNIAALEAIQLSMKPLTDQRQILGFVPLMFEVLKLLEMTLNNESSDSDYEQTQYIIEIIIAIACDKPLLFADHSNAQTQSPLMAFTTAFTQLCVTKQLPNKLRGLALEFFIALAENDPTLVRQKTEIITMSVVNICMDHFLLCQVSDTEWNDLDYGEEGESDSLCVCAEYALDRFITALTDEYVLPLIYKKLLRSNNIWTNNDWRHRHCALTVVTQISDYIAQGSDELCSIIDKVLLLLANDTHYRIKYASINAIGQLCNDHSSMTGSDKYCDRILQQMIAAMDTNNNIKICAHACAALINFVTSLGNKVLSKYLSKLLECVMSVLKYSNTQWNNDKSNKDYVCAQEQCLTCIAALSHSAGQLFDKYYDTFAPILMNIIANAQNKELSDVRSRAIECMGCIGESCMNNPTFVNTHSIQLMNGTIAYFKNEKWQSGDDSFIKVHICLWSRILCAISNDSFEKYLSECVAILYQISQISIIANDYNTNEEKISDENMAMIETENGEMIAIDSQKIENKLAALHTIDSFFDKYGNKMEPFIDKLFDALIQSIKTNLYCYDLKIECIKLSLRYISVMSECQNGQQKLLQMSDALLNVFIAILDEGKGQSDKDNSGESESQCIGVVSKTLLELISSKLSQNLIRTFITEQKLEHIIDSMFLCVIRAQNRIELYSKQEQTRTFDAIAKLEFIEEKEFEDDLLFNIALIIAEFIKIFKDSFLALLFKNDSANMQKLMKFLKPNPQYCSNPQFMHKTGVYIICDIYEQCKAENICKLLSHFMPQIIDILKTDSDASVQQACFYCLGLMIDKCKNNNVISSNSIETLLKLCVKCVTDNSSQYLNASICIFDESKMERMSDESVLKKRQFLGVIDNAMATICKILKDIPWNSNAYHSLMELRNQSLSVWFKHLPLKSDCVEAQTCHGYLFQLLQNKNPIIIGSNLTNLPFIIRIFASIRKTQLSTKELDVVIGEFVQTICKSQPHFAQNLSTQERHNLGL